MNTVNDTKTRRPRRSKADIEDAIMRAAVAQIKKKGFSMALVTDIVKRARIEPIVFYNRYRNLNEFYDSFVKRYDYWISDLVKGIADSLLTREGYEKALDKLFNNLREDTIMLELLRWEVAEGTPVTERTAKLRELDSQALINKYAAPLKEGELDLVGLTAVVVAGIYFLMLHKDRSTFAGIDVNTEEGRQRVENVFFQLSHMIFTTITCRDNVLISDAIVCSRTKLAEAMMAEGMSAEAVERCFKNACGN